MLKDFYRILTPVVQWFFSFFHQVGLLSLVIHVKGGNTAINVNCENRFWLTHRHRRYQVLMCRQMHLSQKHYDFKSKTLTTSSSSVLFRHFIVLLTFLIQNNYGSFTQEQAPYQIFQKHRAKGIIVVWNALHVQRHLCINWIYVVIELLFLKQVASS